MCVHRREEPVTCTLTWGTDLRPSFGYFFGTYDDFTPNFPSAFLLYRLFFAEQNRFKRWYGNK